LFFPLNIIDTIDTIDFKGLKYDKTIVFR